MVFAFIVPMVAKSAAAAPKVERVERAKSRHSAGSKLWRGKTTNATKPFAGKGAEIRARIAANRAKRLAIAEAMKREAGVTEHTVHQDKEDLSGLAYIGTGRILSPQGRRIVELYTLAHECGHIFLHNAGEGYWLPGHVKELEAESYAHQAFRAHGMRVPRRIADWGREYVGSWIAKDQAAGIPIDSRALAYAAGTRSAYAPLRMVPATWAESCLRAPRVTPGRELTTPPLPTWRSRLRLLVDRARAHLAPTLDEARTVLRLASGWSAVGAATTLYALLKVEVLYPGSLPWQHFALSWPGLLTAVTGGLLSANIAILWRTATRLHRSRPGPTKGTQASCRVRVDGTSLAT